MNFFENTILEVKINSQKVKVESIISFARQNELLSICERSVFLKDTKLPISLTLCKAVFDVCVLALQTNIPIEGITEKAENGVYSLGFSLSYNDIDKYVSSSVLQKIKPYIINYDDVWNSIVKTLEMQNIRMLFENIGSALPTAEDIQAQLNEMKNFVSENQKVFDSAVEYSLAQDAIRKAASEK